MPRKLVLGKVKRVVVKMGTSTITDNGFISGRRISRLVADILDVIARGYEIIIVSSGAIGAGCGALGKKRENLTIPEKQALAAVGQTILINEYRRYFMKRGHDVGQILLTEDDVMHRRRFLNARNTFNSLLEMGIIPVVNENDSVVIKEIKFGDNDTLSAHVANIVEADLLIILSDVDGLYRQLSDASPVYEVYKIDEEIRKWAGGVGSEYGTGGMLTKLSAAEIIMKSGEIMVIANGKKKGVIGRILSGEKLGTFFIGNNTSMKSRKRWIAFNMKTRGRLTIDDGAVEALSRSKRSLLASGITGVEGRFDLGDAVEIVDLRRHPIGKGIVNYTRDELIQIRGRKTSEIKRILGSTYYDEVINRDDLILY